MKNKWTQRNLSAGTSLSHIRPYFWPPRLPFVLNTIFFGAIVFWDGTSESWFQGRPQKFWIMAGLESAKPCWKPCKRAPRQSPPSEDEWYFLVLLCWLRRGVSCPGYSLWGERGFSMFFALVPFSNGIAGAQGGVGEVAGFLHSWVSFVLHVISVPHVCFYVYNFFFFLFSFSWSLDVEWISYRCDWRHFFHSLPLR